MPCTCTCPDTSSGEGVALDEGVVNTLPNHPFDTILPDTRDFFSNLPGADFLGSSIDIGGMSIPVWGLVAAGAFFMFSKGGRRF